MKDLTYNEWIMHLLNQLSVEKKKEIEIAKSKFSEQK
jgi:hypothetical protein